MHEEYLQACGLVADISLNSMAKIWRGRPPDLIEGTISRGCNLKLRVRSQCTTIWKESTDFQAFENPGYARFVECKGEMLVRQSASRVAVYKHSLCKNLENKAGYDSGVGISWGMFTDGDEDGKAKTAPMKGTNIINMHKEFLQACGLVADSGLNSMAEIWRGRPPDLIGGTISNGCKFEAQSPIPMNNI